MSVCILSAPWVWTGRFPWLHVEGDITVLRFLCVFVHVSVVFCARAFYRGVIIMKYDRDVMWWSSVCVCMCSCQAGFVKTVFSSVLFVPEFVLPCIFTPTCTYDLHKNYIWTTACVPGLFGEPTFWVFQLHWDCWVKVSFFFHLIKMVF